MYGVRELTDVALDPLEDGLVVPLPGAETDSVVVEGRDGDTITTLDCKGIEMQTNGEGKPFMSVSDIRVRLYVTDARIAFACSKYDKGGGWIGTSPMVLAFNAGSKLLAAQRRKGKVLVGHIRFPWISDVYARGHSFGREQKVRVIVKLPGDDSWSRVDFTLPKDVSATTVASELIRRAARFRLTCEPDLEEEERSRFTDLADLPDLVWEKGGDMVGEGFGSYWPVGEKSARFGSNAPLAVPRQGRADDDGGGKPVPASFSSGAEPGSRALEEAEAEGTVSALDPPAEVGRATPSDRGDEDPSADGPVNAASESPAETPDTAGQRFCTRCGSVRNLRHRFCEACGAEFGQGLPGLSKSGTATAGMAPAHARSPRRDPTRLPSSPTGHRAPARHSPRAPAKAVEATQRASTEPSRPGGSRTTATPLAVAEPHSPSGGGTPRLAPNQVRLAAALVALVFVGGTAAYVAAGGPDDSTPVEQHSDGTALDAEAEEATTPQESPTTNGLPSGSPSDLTPDIRLLLLNFHTFIVEGDYESAWALLSERKQEQVRREDGYAAWRRAQASLTPYLNPENITVRIKSLYERSGVALVDVQGMAWTKPGARCSEWAGTTWVKFEGGAWRYDPGYSTTSERERDWKPKYSQLLGARC